MSFADDYRPGDINALILSNEAREAMISWINSWINHSETKKALILWGQQGIGKTSTAYALANYAGLGIIEMNASEQRNRENMKKVALMASEYRDLFDENTKMPDKLILIDEADNIFESRNKSTGGDSGGISELLDIIKNTKNPVVITMNDYYAFKAKNNAREIISRSLDIEMTPYRRKNEVNYKNFRHSVEQVLKKIAGNEKIAITDMQIDDIIKSNEPDIRAMINDLYLYKVHEHDYGTNSRDTSESIYYLTSDTFRTSDYDSLVRSLSRMDEDTDFYMKWINENIGYEYSDTEDLANAYDLLSMADVYYGNRFRDFSLDNYAKEVTAGISLVVKAKNSHYVKYNFPSYIKKLGMRKKNAEIFNNTMFAGRMASISHTSISTISRNMWFYNIIKRKDKKMYSLISSILDTK
ncbi:MAG: replication factor C large subunit [Ferroplasma sp.]|uniref:replication factor C large subunit n=1 Tax=Ferroplasma sp. TaxID=2591003 RepID=UPI002815F227|nr:replication factor C large subunit [Ferroplasma sp.]WMT52029.1 MAG: replication factor C large subunit [Ferroplasma sp.]